MQKIVGGCLCGSVRYSSNSEPGMVVVCHCVKCQKKTGSAFSIGFSLPSPAINFTGDTLDTYPDNSGSSGCTLNRSFCSRCGSPVAGQGEAYPGLVFINVGTLDNSSWVEPSHHIWCSQKQPWVSINPGAKQMQQDLY